MKKLLVLGLLTALAALSSAQPAHAWINSRFSVGLTWNLQSGGNNFLWGLWHNGQVPVPPDGYGAYGGGYPGYAPALPPPGIGGFLGAAGPGGVAVPPSPAAVPNPATPPLPPIRNTNQHAGQAIPGWYPGQSIYQTTGYESYSYPNGANYPSPSNYSGYTVPSYWYGN